MPSLCVSTSLCSQGQRMDIKKEGNKTPRKINKQNQLLPAVCTDVEESNYDAKKKMRGEITYPLLKVFIFLAMWLIS